MTEEELAEIEERANADIDWRIVQMHKDRKALISEIRQLQKDVGYCREGIVAANERWVEAANERDELKTQLEKATACLTYVYKIALHGKNIGPDIQKIVELTRDYGEKP